MPKIYSRYGDLPESPVKILDTETKLVSQSEADMVSLQAQLSRYGMDSLVAKMQAVQDKFGYADTRLLPDFAAIQQKIVEGNQYFDSLPSSVRAEFNHRSENFYDYCSQNPEKAEERGFITRKKADELNKTLQSLNINKNSKKIDEVAEVVESVEKVENEAQK